MRCPKRRCRLTVDQSGISITEFGLLAPVFMVMIMGSLDLGHTLYMQSILQGAVQKAARDSSLESGGNVTNQSAMDTAITQQVQRLAKNASVTITRTSFRDYTTAAIREKEPFTDSTSGVYANGTCDNGEPYEDSNNDGSWNIDNGQTGQGGAKDTTILATEIVYPRIFPFMKMVGLPADVTINAKTVLVNQPYGDQAAVPVRNCP